MLRRVSLGVGKIVIEQDETVLIWDFPLDLASVIRDVAHARHRPAIPTPTIRSTCEVSG